MDIDKRALFKNVAVFVLTQFTVYYGFKYLLTQLDPLKARKSDKAQDSQIKKKLHDLQVARGQDAEPLTLSEHEKLIASEIIFHDQVQCGFDDIGGLENIIQDLSENVTLPLLHPELFQFPGVSLNAPKGVLLYGPPGCGKTMLAKALASESEATFINVNISTLTDKWFGESNKLISALFSLARKVQPTIIFIDEIDSFLRERQRSDHEAMAMIKAEFMSLWDGIKTSDSENRIVILGATNRKQDIDPAILRRMPKQFAIELPNSAQRYEILKRILRNNQLHKSLDLKFLSENTEGLSGSALTELCRAATAIPHREFLRKHIYSHQEGSLKFDITKLSHISNQNLRATELKDFIKVCQENSSLSCSLLLETLD